eukprot:256492_1
MNWKNVCQCVKQQMWPKLSSTIKSIVDNSTSDNASIFWDNGITDESIDVVINQLKEKRHLPAEEREHLRKLIGRTKNFTPVINNHNPKNVSLAINDFYYKGKQLNKTLLMDIFDVYRIFVFSNFNFRNYTSDHFTQDIIKNG